MKAPLILAAAALSLAACDDRLPPSRDAPTAPAEPAAPQSPDGSTGVTPAPPQQDANRPPPRRVDASQTQCRQDERAFYNCPFGDGRIVSVCIGDETSYRFGPAGSPELDITVAPDEEGVWRVAGRDDGPSTYFRFERGQYDYVVYSGRSGDPQVERSGVAVLRDGELIQRLECPVTSTQTEFPVTMIPTYIPRDPDTIRDGRW